LAQEYSCFDDPWSFTPFHVHSNGCPEKTAKEVKDVSCELEPLNKHKRVRWGDHSGSFQLDSYGLRWDAKFHQLRQVVFCLHRQRIPRRFQLAWRLWWRDDCGSEEGFVQGRSRWVFVTGLMRPMLILRSRPRVQKIGWMSRYPGPCGGSLAQKPTSVSLDSIGRCLWQRSCILRSIRESLSQLKYPRQELPSISVLLDVDKAEMYQNFMMDYLNWMIPSKKERISALMRVRTDCDVKFMNF